MNHVTSAETPVADKISDLCGQHGDEVQLQTPTTL